MYLLLYSSAKKHIFTYQDVCIRYGALNLHKGFIYSSFEQLYKPSTNVHGFGALSASYFVKNVATSLDHPQNQCSLRKSLKTHSFEVFKYLPMHIFNARLMVIFSSKKQGSGDFIIFLNCFILKRHRNSPPDKNFGKPGCKDNYSYCSLQKE